MNKFIPSDPCPKCGGALTYELVNVVVDGDQCEPDAALYCDHCEIDLEIDWSSYRCDSKTFWRLTPEQKSQITKLMGSLDSELPVPTQDEAPIWKDCFIRLPDGDFSYTQDEGGDWFPCYDSRSEKPWYKLCNAYNFGRTNGLAWIEETECDADGNWDVSWRLEEEKPGVAPDAYREYLIKMHPNWILRGWCKYAHWVAENGEDPLHEYTDLSTANIIKSLKSIIN